MKLLNQYKKRLIIKHKLSLILMAILFQILSPQILILALLRHQKPIQFHLLDEFVPQDFQNTPARIEDFP